MQQHTPNHQVLIPQKSPMGLGAGWATQRSTGIKLRRCRAGSGSWFSGLLGPPIRLRPARRVGWPGDMTPPAENQPVKAVRKRKQHSDRSLDVAPCTPSGRKGVRFAGLLG
ncbi:hypothetical protein PspLS_05350, partial [Pyricularia sp. CBS 133598]